MKIMTKYQFHYLLLFPRNKPSKSVTVGSDRFIVLNDSASPKMVMKMYFNFVDYLKSFLSCFNIVEATHI